MNRTVSLASVLRLLVVALAIGVLGAAVVSQARSPVAAVNTTDGIALKGYDPVAYFTAGKPAPGVEPYSYRWQGVTYRFASAENRERFQAAPERYLPQYGGYCAYAMSLNLIADINPVRWAVVDGKLYLNNSWFSHTLWSANKGGNIAAADGNWAVFPKTEVAQ
jgi:YHS domain-containing protein